jgi:hypothetical protein
MLILNSASSPCFARFFFRYFLSPNKLDPFPFPGEFFGRFHTNAAKITAAQIIDQQPRDFFQVNSTA